MVMKYYALGQTENSRAVRAIRIIFGVALIAIAVFWIIYNVKTLKADGSAWITIFFLFGFGFYQIWSGTGKAVRFIEFGKTHIRLKRTAFLPPVIIQASEIERVGLFSLNVIFYMKTRKKILIRFGTTYQDVNEKIVDEIITFAESCNIPLELKNEDL
jgi:hypothetical protein